jgi:hypothetical protein
MREASPRCARLQAPTTTRRPELDARWARASTAQKLIKARREARRHLAPDTSAMPTTGT